MRLPFVFIEGRPKRPKVSLTKTNPLYGILHNVTTVSFLVDFELLKEFNVLFGDIAIDVFCLVCCKGYSVTCYKGVSALTILRKQ